MTTDDYTRHASLVLSVRSRRLGRTLAAVYRSRPVQNTLCVAIGAGIVLLSLALLWTLTTLAWAVFG